MRSVKSDSRHLRDLADAIIDRPKVKPKLTGSSTNTGNSEITEVNTLPVPFGAAGDVLTVIAVGSDKSAAWQAPTGGVATGKYRSYVLVSDGSGGFNFVDDGSGNPVESLEDLE